MLTPDCWRGVELRHLAALVAVADSRSFRSAAERLGYAQSAVSQHISLLERSTGVQLVVRQHGVRSCELTEAGALLVLHSRRILDRLEVVRADMRAVTSGRSGSVRLGVCQSFAPTLLPGLLRRFGRSHPDVALHVTEAHMDGPLLGLVARGQLDLSVGEAGAPSAALASRELLRDPYVLVVPAGFEPPQRPMRPADLAALPWITRRSRGAGPNEQLRARGLAPRVAFTADSDAAVRSLVAAGLGVGVVPGMLAPSGDCTTVRVELGDLLEPQRIVMSWHALRPLSGPVQALRSACAEVARELSPS